MAVVGAGGSGSIFLSHLCRIWQAWTTLGGNAFDIQVYDPDDVSEANLGRQCFCAADVGQPKAQVLAMRMRAFFGIPITGRVSYAPVNLGASLVVGCVDNLGGRLAMRKSMTKGNGYWLDLGNTADSGQVVLGGHGLPDFFDVFPNQRRAKDRKDLPSCSMAEALEKQDLFINSTVATLAGQLLWQLMRRGGINHHGYFVNLASGRVLPLEVTAP